MAARQPMWPLALTFVLFQASWLTCAIGAARDVGWIGITACATAALVHLMLARRRMAEASVLISAGVVGAAVECMLLGAGLVGYPHTASGMALPPAWIIALWIAFATTLGATERLLGSHLLVKTGVAGAILGPLSYLAADWIGALALAPPVWKSLLAISTAWLLAYPVLMACYRRFSAS